MPVEEPCNEQELRVALAESIKLQSHYAGLLNLYDGGRRRQFVTQDEWIARLRETGSLATLGLEQLDQAGQPLPAQSGAGAVRPASVQLHSEGEDDEPFELDVDVTMSCDCGTTTTERHQLYKCADDVHEVCDGCGAEYRVDVSVGIGFKAQAIKVADGVLSETAADRQGGPHAR